MARRHFTRQTVRVHFAIVRLRKRLFDTGHYDVPWIDPVDPSFQTFTTGCKATSCERATFVRLAPPDINLVRFAWGEGGQGSGA